MTRRTITLTLLVGLVAAAQQPERYYAQAFYTKWKPGKQAEGQAFIKDVPYKASLEWLKKQPGAVGQITMSRVVPRGADFADDRLRLAIFSKPPDLGGSDSPGSAAYVEAVGMRPAEYTAKLRSVTDNTRFEIWQSIFRHGAIKEGDYVRVVWMKVAGEHTSAYLDYRRNWLSRMYAAVTKRGDVARGLETWQIRGAGEDEPSIVNVTAYPNSDASYRSFGSEIDEFRAAHPGKNYNAYRQDADAVGRNSTTVRTVIYRVDLAVWK